MRRIEVGLISADGNIGVIQTMVGELVKKPEHERESGPTIKEVQSLI